MVKAKFKAFPVTYRGENNIPLEQEVNDFLTEVEGRIIDIKMKTVVDPASEPYRADIDLFIIVIYQANIKKGGK